MKKLISVFSVALVLVFSCVLISYADEYNCELVPDSPYIWGLQVVDNTNGNVVESESRRAVARASASASSSDTSADVVYRYKDLVTIYYDWVYPNFNVDPDVIGLHTVNGYRGYRFKSSTEEFYQKYNSFKTGQKQLPLLRSTNKYHVTFSMKQTNAWGAYRFYLYDSVDSSRVIYLAKKDYSQSIGVNASFDFYITIPESWTGTPTLAFESTKLQYSDGLYSIFINDLTFTDVTNENLDKALDKFGNKIDQSINPSVPYEKWDNGSLKDSAGKLKDAESKLPTVDFNAIEELKNSIDISSYSHAFAAINQLFIRLVDTVGITPLIFFACFFGFCIFLIGRKLSGG